MSFLVLCIFYHNSSLCMKYTSCWGQEIRKLAIMVFRTDLAEKNEIFQIELVPSNN